MNLYPLLLEPAYKDYIWGGTLIPRVFGRPLPEGIYAESWEVSDRPEGPSRVTNGPLAGQSLADVIHTFGPAIAGLTDPDTCANHERARRSVPLHKEARSTMEGAAPSAPATGASPFPLLVKLIDARERLSLQVHPDDTTAAFCGGEAKTEAWHVLQAVPGAQVFAGLRPGVTASAFREALAASRLETCLRAIPVQPGDTIFIPGGRVHAICEGCLLLEVQQNSNTTYRVYDWGRVGHDGKPRELHIAKAFQVIRWEDAGEPKTVPRALIHADGATSVELVTSPYFRLERLDLKGPVTCRHDGRSFHALFTSGTAVTVETGGEKVEVPFGRSCLIPAAIREYRLLPRGPGELLRTSAP